MADGDFSLFDFPDHPVSFTEAFERMRFRAIGFREVDGDTIEAYVDAGHENYSRITYRLAGIDTPEVYGPKDYEGELQDGRAASRFTRDLIVNAPLLIRTYAEKGKYGRRLADVFVLRDGAWTDLAEMLRGSGHDKRQIMERMGLDYDS